LTNWIIKEHPDFFKDLQKLGIRELRNFYKKKTKIKQDPLRVKHLSGGDNCYREPITDNLRLVYYVEANIIWLLTVGTHKKVFKQYGKRLHSLKNKL
tara:strand:+ start:33666 stop:33956 length:291 start_codon:yes stop_codon:yes gene_type:complete